MVDSSVVGEEGAPVYTHPHQGVPYEDFGVGADERSVEFLPSGLLRVVDDPLRYRMEKTASVSFRNNATLIRCPDVRTRFEFGGRYGKIRGTVRLSVSEESASAESWKQEQRLPKRRRREIARVLAWYPGAIASLLTLADTGPLPAHKLTRESASDDHFLEMIAEFRRCGLVVIKKQLVGLTEIGEFTVEKLRRAASE